MADPPNTRRFDAGRTEVLTVPAATTATPTDARPSAAFERYVPGTEIARGGMGRVMVGTDTRLGREVAIKEALPHGSDLLRFEREVRITARLEHPSIVPLYDAGVTAAGRPVYVMRKVSGQPLDRLIERAGEPDPRRGASEQRLALLPHVLAAAHALGHAHRRGVIHRDVKPANILIGELGETVVIDWGLAKVIGEDEAGPAPGGAPGGADGELATQTGAVFGTPSYMAPEQARGEPLDPRSDVYALGATLCHVLTGRLPLPGHLTEVLAGAHDPARAAPALAQLAELALPPELTAIIDKAMQFAPAHRYPDGAALADDLNRFLAGRLVAAHRYTRAERFGRWIRRHRALVAVVAGSALILSAGGVLAIRGVVLARERTWQAEQRARAERREAEAARLREADRADEDVIVRARTEVERDPTTATAMLATLAPGSRRWPEARAIAIEARLRGVAQVYGEEHPPRAFALGPDPRLLLVAGSTAGKIAIVDLEHRRERTLDACAGRCIAAWGDGGAAVWVGPAAGGLYAVDVTTGARRPPLLPVGPDALASDHGPVFADDKIVALRADPAATLAGLALHDGRAATLDAAGLHYLSGLTAKVEALDVAPDGTWAAFATPRELVVVDRTGRELARSTAALYPATLVAAPAGGQLAIATAAGAVLEVEVAGGKAAIRNTTLPWRVFLIHYVHDRPYVNVSERAAMRPLHPLDDHVAEIDRVMLSCETLRGYTATVASKLELIGPKDTRPLVPPVHDQVLAIAGRRNVRYLAAHTRSAILTWDLADVLPEQVASDVNGAWLFDDRTALVSELDQLAWIDLATGARTPIAAPRGLMVEGNADVATGRELVFLQLSGPDRPLAAVLAHRGRSEVTPIELPGWQRIILWGSHVLAGTTAGEVAVIDDGAAPRVLHRLGAPVDILAAHGPWIAAHAESGALVRINTATGATDTTRPPPATHWIQLTSRGDVYLAADRTVLRWRGGDFDRIATLPGRIEALAEFRDGERLLAATPQHEFYAVVPDLPDETRRVVRLFFRSETPLMLDRTSRYLVANTVAGEATLLDLTHSTQWRIPSAWQVQSISPTGQTALLAQAGSAAIIHLDVPDDPGQLRAWITGATNYGLDAPAP
ncbi:MAG TPA: serine/threonine-protein kinase [Kofleriaceae bacterium]|nr:serine/threonine-protein kinase [Kofleriaceae bacterium]